MVFLKNKSKGLLSIILPLILLSLFNNCGDVTFQTDEAGLLQQLSTNASVTINNNDQFTRNRDVILNIHSDRATEMMVSNSTQDTVWEPYQQIKAWQLSRLNTTATVYVRFRDKGIASEWEQDEIIHDNIKPVLRAVNPPQDYTTASFSTININVLEVGSGIDDNYCSQNSAVNNFSLCSARQKLSIEQSVTHFSDGANQYYAYSTDLAGNKSDTLAINWVVDRTPPTVRFTGQLPNLTSERTARINFNGTDQTSGISGYLCSWQNGSFGTCNSPLTRSGLIDGNYTLSVKSIDKAGNQSQIITHRWEVHTSAPVITFVQPLPQTVSTAKNTQIGFNGRDKDFIMTEFQCSLNGATYRTCTSPHATGTLADGKQTLNVRGKDRLGQFSLPFSYSWTVDTTINNPTFVKTPKKLSNEIDAHFQIGNIDADVTQVLCKLNNEAFKPCPTTNAFSFDDLTSRLHTLSVYAIDHVGNRSTTISYSFTVDTIKPIVSVRGPANNSLATAIDTFTITASDNKTPVGDLVYQCSIDSGAFELCSRVFSRTLTPNTEHVFVARVRDESGNFGVSVPYIYKTVTLQLSASFTTTPEAVNSPEDEIKFEFNVDNGGYPISSTTCTLKDGSNTLESINCQPDQLVNLGALDEDSYTIIVDIENTFGQTTSISHDFEVQKAGECNGSEVCLVLKDDFERSDIRAGDFGWNNFLLDSNGNTNDLDISTKSLGQASSGDRSAFFTGRRGGSVHGLFLSSREFDLRNYSSLTIEFDYIMASFENWSYNSQSGLENFRVEVCTLGELQCGVKPGQENFSKMEDPTRWKSLYSQEATSPINQDLNGNNHTVADYTNIKGNDLTLNLNNANLVTDKSKVIIRWSFKMDEGIIDENGQVNYKDGETPDAGILDNIVVKAFRN